MRECTVEYTVKRMRGNYQFATKHYLIETRDMLVARFTFHLGLTWIKKYVTVPNHAIQIICIFLFNV